MKKIFLIFVLSSLFLFSCNSVRESAGVNRKVIDEYAIIENPPLVIPPNINLLPPEQIESKNIDDIDSELAKEILFGLDDEDNFSGENSSLINKIVQETNANSIENDIRDTINQDFAGEKSSSDDETVFKNKDELDEAIEATKNKDNKNDKKQKKKKRIFFF